MAACLELIRTAAQSVQTARRYRTVNIRAGKRTLTAADSLPDNLRDAQATINHRGMH